MGKEKTAIVLSAFGTLGPGRIAYSLLEEHLRKNTGLEHFFWGYTSFFICKKGGWATLVDILIHVKKQGFGRVVLLPLQIFPSKVYKKTVHWARKELGLQLALGDTLLQRWTYVIDLLAVLEQDFLSPDRGINVLGLHGSSSVCDSVHTRISAIETLVAARYRNVVVATIEGRPDFSGVLARQLGLKKVWPGSEVRILPLLLTPGMHTQKDLLGEKESWKKTCLEHGLSLNCLYMGSGEEKLIKCLIAYPEVLNFFCHRLATCLKRLT